MIIRILKLSAAEESPQIIEEIEVGGIDASSVAPVNEKVGALLTFPELLDLLSKVRPLHTDSETDIYFARTAAYVDADYAERTLAVPHHTGFKLVADSVLQGFADQDNLRIDIG